MTQLLIQNKGEAPVESFTLLGASLSRDNGGLIGQFGSGTKLAITALLRAGLKVVVYSGLTRMEFKTKDIIIKDGVEEVQQRQVFVQFGGTSRRKQDLGWVVGFGAIDWQSEDMAVREFVANAIDHTIKQGDRVPDATVRGDLLITTVSNDAVRAKEGYTRVFIEANEVVEDYVNELPRRFLHFTGVDLSKRIMPKLGDRKKAQIYYNGVWVRELHESPDSLCDYNFTGDQIKIDESRNLDAYTTRAAIARLYRNCGTDDLVRLFAALSKGEPCLESGLDAYYIKPNSWETVTDEQKQTWREAWKRVNGDAVACSPDDGTANALAAKKGNVMRVVNEANVLDVIKAYGVPTVNDVLTEDERAGRSITAPTEDAITALDIVWGWVSDAQMVDIFNKPAPRLFGFEGKDGDLGFRKDDAVYLRNDLTDFNLLEETVKQVAKYATGSITNEDFIARLLVRVVTGTGSLPE